MKHIVFTGPESTGKSTLSKLMAEQFGAFFIEEYARQYLEAQDNKYSYYDLQKIAFGQFSAQLGAFAQKENVIISDTDLLTLIIWSQYKFGSVDPFIQEWFSLQQVDLYILCFPDLPWEEDPQRESPNNLLDLYEKYRQELETLGIPYKIVRGQGADRVKCCSDIVRLFLAE